VFEGAKIFRAKGCLNCHLISGNGGRRGPDLTYIGDTLSESDIIIRIVNGGVNVPAFGNSLKPEELAQLTAFLQSRKRPSACWVGNDPALRNRTLAYSSRRVLGPGGAHDEIGHVICDGVLPLPL
jgi:mono/diheme cytochrome c family protein